jgi:hypothetical protein
MGGIALALFAMTYGLWYAAFAEHQALDGIGTALTNSFIAAANRDPTHVTESMDQYREAKYRYDRSVDAHGHWIGLAMLLIVLAIGFDYVSYPQKQKRVLAWVLLLGSAMFPFAVLVESVSHAAGPKILAVLGSGLVIIALAATILGFLRRPTSF